MVAAGIEGPVDGSRKEIICWCFGREGAVSRIRALR
jgi:hypothetical protein